MLEGANCKVSGCNAHQLVYLSFGCQRAGFVREISRKKCSAGFVADDIGRSGTSPDQPILRSFGRLARIGTFAQSHFKPSTSDIMSAMLCHVMASGVVSAAPPVAHRGGSGTAIAAARALPTSRCLERNMIATRQQLVGRSNGSATKLQAVRADAQVAEVPSDPLSWKRKHLFQLSGSALL